MTGIGQCIWQKWVVVRAKYVGVVMMIGSGKVVVYETGEGKFGSGGSKCGSVWRMRVVEGHGARMETPGAASG